MRLTGPAIWIAGDRLAVRDGTPGQERLSLVDRRGKELRTLATGRFVSFLTLSPDRRHLAFTHDTGSGPKIAGGAPSDYLTVIRVNKP